VDYLSPWMPAQGAVLEIGAGHCHWINSVSASSRLAIDMWPEVGRYAAAGVDFASWQRMVEYVDRIC